MGALRFSVFGAMVGALAGLACWLQREPALDGVPPDLARAVRELRMREPLYHRTVGALVQRITPALASKYPRLLGVESNVAVRRLEACHALIAWGPTAAPVLPMLVDAFCDRDHDVRAYAFLSLVHLEVRADRVIKLVQERSGDPAVQFRHCAGLLADEDEAVRAFAWNMIEAGGSAEFGGIHLIEDLAKQTYDAGLARRAMALLARAGERTGERTENPRISD